MSILVVQRGLIVLVSVFACIFKLVDRIEIFSCVILCDSFLKLDEGRRKGGF